MPSSIIKKVDFKKEPLGEYSLAQVEKTWKKVYNFFGVSDGRCAIALDKKNKKCLQVNFVKYQVGPRAGGAQWKMKLEKSYKEIYYQFKVKFPVGFNFVLGGKLPGAGGGTLPAGGKKTDANGFTVRMMWRGENQGKKGRIVQYVYYLDKASGNKWGEDMWWKTKGKNLYFTIGKWHTIKTRVKMNTPGKKDGLIQSWLDGKLALDKKVRFRKNKKLGIDTFIFTTFFGGNTIRWAPKKNERVLFDEFKIYI